MLDLLLISIFCLLGVFIGLFTGLLPGLHVNNISLFFLSFSPAILAALAPLTAFGISDTFLLVLLCGCIISLALAHSFFSAVPATFLGAPDEETALSILPAHRMLLEGQGYRAVTLTAIGSIGAVFFCLLLVYPLRFMLGSPLFFYESIREVMVWILIALSTIMIATEKKRIAIHRTTGVFPSFAGMGFALFVFLLSGVFGIILFSLSVQSPVGFKASVLFPALAGLFGVPTLLSSYFTQPTIPVQTVEPLRLTRSARHSSVVSIFTGTLSGIFVSILPGVTSAVGTVVALNIRRNNDTEQTILTLSAVNTACTFSTVIVLFVLLRARSGAMLTVHELISVAQWSDSGMPVLLCYFLIFLVLAGCISFFLTIGLGRLFATKVTKIPYRVVLLGSIVFLNCLVFLFTGLLGLFVLLTATCIGLIPVVWGVRRSHCMGVLLVPIILYFL